MKHMCLWREEPFIFVACLAMVLPFCTLENGTSDLMFILLVARNSVG